MVGLPGALFYGIAGIFKDDKKWLAILTTLGSAGLIAAYVYQLSHRL